CSLEGVMEQGGWKGSDTLMKFYVGLKESKMDFEFLDIPREKEETWREWLIHRGFVFPSYVGSLSALMCSTVQSAGSTPRSFHDSLRVFSICFEYL
ncbi:unnamed protein product, partial [marine sediment metagenome]